MTKCIFCELSGEILFENEHCLAFFDRYPVSRGHLLIIPKAHKPDYFALSTREKADLDDLMQKAKIYLEERYQPDGYNIGFNCGVVSKMLRFQ